MGLVVSDELLTFVQLASRCLGGGINQRVDLGYKIGGICEAIDLKMDNNCS